MCWQQQQQQQKQQQQEEEGLRAGDRTEVVWKFLLTATQYLLLPQQQQVLCGSQQHRKTADKKVSQRTPARSLESGGGVLVTAASACYAGMSEAAAVIGSCFLQKLASRHSASF